MPDARERPGWPLVRLLALLPTLPVLLAACVTPPAQPAAEPGSQPEASVGTLTLAPETEPWGGGMLRAEAGGSWVAAALHDVDLLGLWHIDRQRNATPLGGRLFVGYHPDDVAAWDHDSFVVAVEGTVRLQRWQIRGDDAVKVDELGTPFGVRDLVAADIDGDGHQDLLLAPYSGRHLAILWGEGGFRFSEPQFIEVGSAPWHPLLLDWSGDGRTDIVVGILDGREINLARNLGERRFEVETVHRVQGNNPRHMALGDVSRDGYANDLVIAVELGPAELLLRGSGGADHEVLEIAPVRLDYVGAAVLADGTIALGDEMRVVLVRIGEGGEMEKRWLPAGSLPSPMQVFDLDGDGYEDLIVFNSAGGGVTIHFGPLWERSQAFAGDAAN